MARLSRSPAKHIFVGQLDLYFRSTKFSTKFDCVREVRAHLFQVDLLCITQQNTRARFGFVASHTHLTEIRIHNVILYSVIYNTARFRRTPLVIPSLLKGASWWIVLSSSNRLPVLDKIASPILLPMPMPLLFPSVRPSCHHQRRRWRWITVRRSWRVRRQPCGSWAWWWLLRVWCCSWWRVARSGCRREPRTRPWPRVLSLQRAGILPALLRMGRLVGRVRLPLRGTVIPSKLVSNSVNTTPTAGPSRSTMTERFLPAVNITNVPRSPLQRVVHGTPWIPNTWIPSPIPIRADRRVRTCITTVIINHNRTVFLAFLFKCRF